MVSELMDSIEHNDTDACRGGTVSEAPETVGKIDEMERDSMDEGQELSAAGSMRNDLLSESAAESAPADGKIESESDQFNPKFDGPQLSEELMTNSPSDTELADSDSAPRTAIGPKKNSTKRNSKDSEAKGKREKGKTKAEDNRRAQLQKELENVSNMANYNKLFSAVLQQVNVSTDQVISKRAKLVSNLRRKNNLSGTTNQDADKEGQMARRGMKYFIPQATRSRLLVVKDEARPSGSTPSALQELTARRMNSCRLTGPKDVDAQGAAEKRRLRDALRKSAITQGADEHAKLLGCKNRIELARKIQIELEEEKRREEREKERAAQFRRPIRPEMEGQEEEEEEEENEEEPENSGEAEEDDGDSDARGEDDESKDLAGVDRKEATSGHQSSVASVPLARNNQKEEDNSVEDKGSPTTAKGDDGAAETAADASTVGQRAPESDTPKKKAHQDSKTSDKSQMTDDPNDEARTSIERDNTRRTEPVAGQEGDNDAVEYMDGASDSGEDQEQKTGQKRDKAAAFRALLEKERKRALKVSKKKKGALGEVLEEEAEESDEDMPNKESLFQFGFGKLQLDKENEDEEKEELSLLKKAEEEDLEGIVDDVSDDERDRVGKESEAFHLIEQQRDRQEIKQVMRRVREGFGRREKAISRGGGGTTRGRFDLDKLVAVDGDKREAARLGLLESDEELSDAEKEGKNKDGEEEEEEEDDEALMERFLRERHIAREQMYISSEDEEDSDAEEGADGANGDKESRESDDEKREREQARAFSLRCKMNRRLKRIRSQTGDEAITSIVNDEDSQQILSSITVTNKRKAVTSVSGPQLSRSASLLTSRPPIAAFRRMSSLATSSTSTSTSQSGPTAASRLNQEVASKHVVFTSIKENKPPQSAKASDESKDNKPTVKSYDSLPSLSSSSAPLKRHKTMRGSRGSLFQALSVNRCVRVQGSSGL